MDREEVREEIPKPNFLSFLDHLDLILDVTSLTSHTQVTQKRERENVRVQKFQVMLHLRKKVTLSFLLFLASISSPPSFN